MNQVILVGRLTNEPEIITLESGKTVLNILLAVQRPYKNEEGNYETDFIDCELWNSVANTTCEYCHKGDLLGVKGRIKTDYYDKEDETRKVMSVVAEKVTFLSSSNEATETE